MLKDQPDEAMVRLITEVVLRVLAEMNITPASAARSGAEPPLQETAECCCGNPDPVYIPGKGSGRNLITEREVLEIVKQKKTQLVCPKNSIITALAADRLKAEGITVIRQ